MMIKMLESYLCFLNLSLEFLIEVFISKEVL